MDEKRTITDADAEAIAVAFECRVERRFFLNLGKGTWAIVWRVLVGGMIALAAYGTFKGH